MSGSTLERATVRWPTGLLGMLALVAAVEAAIDRVRPDLVRPWAEDWRAAARAAEAKAPGSEVLCFGDSLVKYGVLPRVIEARAGLRAYNLAVGGGTMPSAYFLLRRALDAGARPRAVVVDFAALMAVEGPTPPILNYPDLGTFGDCLGLALEARAPGFFGASAAAKVLPSAHFRFEVRANLRAMLDGRSASERASVASHSRVWAREAGAQPTEPGRRAHPQEGLLVDGVCPPDWTPGPVEAAYLERFLKLAGSRGIAVYWLIPPLSPEVEARRAAQGLAARYDAFARSVAARHPGLVIVDARGSGHDRSIHVDPFHLDRLGASSLTGDLARVIADRLRAPTPDSPRWVELPPIGGRSDAVARGPGAGAGTR